MGAVTLGDIPKHWPTVATAANWVSSAPMTEMNSGPAGSRAAHGPNRARISAPWPWPVTILSRRLISCTKDHPVTPRRTGLRDGEQRPGVGVGQHDHQPRPPHRQKAQPGPPRSPWCRTGGGAVGCASADRWYGGLFQLSRRHLAGPVRPSPLRPLKRPGG